MKTSDLDEGYGIIVTEDNEKRVLFVHGKQISEHCAITYDHMANVYSFTLIGTGMSIKVGVFYTLKEAMKSEFCVKQFEQNIESEELKRGIVTARMFYEKLLKQKNFYKKQK